MGDFQANLAASYRAVEAMARERGDESALGTLTEIGPPPWTNPRYPGQLRRIVRKFEHATTTPWGELGWGAEYATPEARAAYFAGEEFSWVKFVGLKGDGFANEVNLVQSGLEFGCPVVLIQGEGNLLTTADVSRAYFDRISAPQKRYITVPDAGHDPNRAMLAAQFRVRKELGQ